MIRRQVRPQRVREMIRLRVRPRRVREMIRLRAVAAAAVGTTTAGREAITITGETRTTIAGTTMAVIATQARTEPATSLHQPLLTKAAAAYVEQCRVTAAAIVAIGTLKLIPVT